MAEELYGPVPRCLTYLDTPLRPMLPSLLSQQMTAMEPHDIGDSLIALSGMKSHLDEEEHQRDTALSQQRNLKNAEEEDAKTTLDEEADLAVHLAVVEVEGTVGEPVAGPVGDQHDVVFREELETLARLRGATIHYLVGERGRDFPDDPLGPASLMSIVPDLQLRERGILADVAPTALQLLGIEQPKAMTAKSLLAG